MDERTARISRNEGVFRTVNEQINSLADRFRLDPDRLQFVCECGHGDCAEHIHMSADQYAHVRSDSRWFAVKPGHEIPDTEDVVERGDEFFVVRKHEGGPAEIADA